MKCYFCGEKTNGKQFWGESIYHKQEKFNVCENCYDEDLELVMECED